jgi:hypothetical protein
MSQLQNVLVTFTVANALVVNGQSAGGGESFSLGRSLGSSAAADEPLSIEKGHRPDSLLMLQRTSCSTAGGCNARARAPATTWRRFRHRPPCLRARENPNRKSKKSMEKWAGTKLFGGGRGCDVVAFKHKSLGGGGWGCGSNFMCRKCRQSGQGNWDGATLDGASIERLTLAK